MTDPAVPFPAVTPETRQLARTAAREAGNFRNHGHAWSWDSIADAVLAATVPAIEAAARKQALQDAINSIHRGRIARMAPSPSWIDKSTRDAVAAIRSLMPTTEATKPPLPPVNRLLGITVDDEPAVSLSEPVNPGSET